MNLSLETGETIARQSSNSLNKQTEFNLINVRLPSTNICINDQLDRHNEGTMFDDSGIFRSGHFSLFNKDC